MAITQTTPETWWLKRLITPYATSPKSSMCLALHIGCFRMFICAFARMPYLVFTHWEWVFAPPHTSLALPHFPCTSPHFFDVLKSLRI